jgi:L,D-transpeptidase ErfK/SrfK
MKCSFKPIVAACMLFTLVMPGFSLTYPVGEGQDVMGQVQYVHANKGDRLYKVARHYEMGFYELIEANPDINRHSPISPEYTILIPSEFVLPNVERKGIVINLPELRLYYFMKNGEVRTEPIAIGRYNWDTPTIKTTVVQKRKNPRWYVPKSIQEAGARKGIFYPDVVAAGPKNPLGKFALKLGSRSYLIHGTNNPTTIGKRASSGCMRMYPEDIEKLFAQVPVGTPVHIIDQHYKLGWKNNKLYLEVHEPLYETAKPETEQVHEITGLIRQMTQARAITINWPKVRDLIERPSGVPAVISQSVGYRTQDYTGYYQDHPSVSGSIELVNRQP